MTWLLVLYMVWIAGILVWLAIYAIAEADENGSINLESGKILICIFWPATLWIVFWAWLGGRAQRKQNTPHH